MSGHKEGEGKPGAKAVANYCCNKPSRTKPSGPYASRFPKTRPRYTGPSRDEERLAKTAEGKPRNDWQMKQRRRKSVRLKNNRQTMQPNRSGLSNKMW